MSEKIPPALSGWVKNHFSREALSGRIRRIAGDPRLCAVILINLLFTLFFLFMCLNTGLYGSDYEYRYKFDTESVLTFDRVDSLGDVIASQTAHYKTVNGRSTPNFLFQSALIFSGGFFRVLNAVIYCLLGVGMYLHTLSAKDRRTARHRPLSQLAVYLIPWLLFPDYGNVFHIEHLAANYLWGMAVIVWFLLPYRLLFEQKDVFKCDINDGHFARRTYVSAIVMFSAGTAAGWCSENGSAAALLMIGCMGAYYLRRQKMFPFWFISGFAGCVFGFIMLLVSPGSKVQADSAAKTSFIGRLSGAVCADTMMPYGCAVIVLTVCLCFLTYTDTHRSRKAAAEFAVVSSAAIIAALILNLIIAGRSVSAYINLALCCIAAVYFFRLQSGYHGHRIKPGKYLPWVYFIAAFAANTLLAFAPAARTGDQLPFLLLFTTAAAMILESTVGRMQIRFRIYSIKRVLIASLIIYSVISLLVVSVRTDRNYKQFELMEQTIESTKSVGVTDITLKKPELSSDRRVAGLNIADNDPDSWINQAFCQYYGISSVTFE